MKHEAFSVYDSCAQAFITPFFLPVRDIAQRVFGDCCNDPNHAFSKHPADYTLFSVGYWDDHEGALIPHTPERICNGYYFVKRQQVLDEAKEV